MEGALWKRSAMTDSFDVVNQTDGDKARHGRMQRRALIAEEIRRYLTRFGPSVPKAELIAYLDAELELHPKTLQPHLDALSHPHSPRAPFLQYTVDGVAYYTFKDAALLAEDAPSAAPQQGREGDLA